MEKIQFSNGDKETSTTDYGWFLSCALITGIATFLRFFWLALKPFHHDEGVNGFFLTNLFRDGVYKYDPANYHGPTLYYISLAFAKVFGLETVPVRTSVAIFGVLTVVLAFYLRSYIGRTGALFAALVLALSPGMVYISRYFIHEMFFVFLSLAVVMSVMFFIDKQKAGPGAIGWMVLILLVCFLPSALSLGAAIGGENAVAGWAFRIAFLLVEFALIALVIRMLLAWNEGRPIYLLLAAACISLMFATKETAFITLGTMLIAGGCIWIWQKIYKRRPFADENDEIDDQTLSWSNFRAALGSRTDRLLIVVACSAVFIYIFVLFFSSFFTYPEGVKKAFEAYVIWTKTGGKDHTQNGLWAYAEWGMQSEAPILILSAVGTLIAFTKARHRFAMFAGLWAFGLFAAYTIIPYKTPWLALSFLLPMCVMAGYAINELAAAKNFASRALAAILAVVAVAVLGYQTYDQNFVRYDDEDQAYVYAHTQREFLDMMNEIEHYAEKSGKGKQAKIEIVTPDYWPMVWYTKDYPNAIYHGKLADVRDSEMIVAKKGEQDNEMIRRYSANYEYIGSYKLRSGVDLVLLVRRDLAGDDGQELYRMDDPTR